MGRPAAIILAHANPAQVARLIDRLAGLDIFLHCDARTPSGVFAQMTQVAGSGVHIVARRRTTLASWSLVEAELASLRAALEHSSAEHIIVLSGTCYPLMSVADLTEEIGRWPGRTRMRLNSVPYPGWGTPRNDDGGMWRFRRRFVTLGGQALFVRGVPLRTFKRTIPRELSLMASLHWKIYAREHVSVLLAVLDERPDLVRFWRTTLVPEESAIASILSSPELVGDVVDELRDDLPWCFEWAGNSGHPRWLRAEDFDWLSRARLAPLREPDDRAKDPDDVAHGTRASVRKLFARKLPADDTRLADMIDEHLRVA